MKRLLKKPPKKILGESFYSRPAAALRKVLGDEKLRKKYSEKAVEIREDFSIGKIAGIWEDTLNGISKKNEL